MIIFQSSKQNKQQKIIFLVIYQTYFVSSKTGDGIKDLTEDLQNQFKLHKDDQKKVYVIGQTNTGKSSFLNKINEIQQIRSINNIKKFQTLTISSYPNTTLDFIKVKNLHLGFPIYDTPGIPIQQQQQLAKFGQEILVTKQLNPVIISMREQNCLFLGGLCRIDVKDGCDLDFYIYCNSNINIHKSINQKANQFYLNNYGKILKPIMHEDIKQMEFKKYEIEIDCNSKGESEKELEIYQIGIISFRSNKVFEKKTNLILYLPKEIQFNIRDKIFKTEQAIKRNKLQKRYLN